MTRSRCLIALTAIAIVTAVFIVQSRRSHPDPEEFTFVQESPPGVMGTTCLIVAVVPSEGAARGKEAIQSAVAELRRVEALMSGYLENSEISRLNSAGAETSLALSAESLEVLRLARQIGVESEGAFDVTCGPLVGLWREAGQARRLPAPDAVARARRRSGWKHFELQSAGIRKHTADARIDLGGIAKGWAIDRAVDSLRMSGCAGGLVDIGGDLRVFGTPPSLSEWPVEIRSPFHGGAWRTLFVQESAVCTSGDYARFVEIEGQKYSHIVDPRSGHPVRDTHSVTVLAPDAAMADAWATALSVLGPEGFPLLPADSGIEAIIVQGDAVRPKVAMTKGFESHLIAPGS